VIRVRPYDPDDRTFVLSLSPRLTIGMPAWRDAQKCLIAVQGWVAESIEQHGHNTAVFIAIDEQGKRLGFATITHNTHFTGERQAYIGELVTDESAEGTGVGKALLQTCERWARDQGYRIIAVATGAGNTNALDFYHHLGYHNEDVTLIKLLEEPGSTDE